MKPATKRAVKPAVKRSDDLSRQAQLIRSRITIGQALELELLSLLNDKVLFWRSFVEKVVRQSRPAVGGVILCDGVRRWPQSR